MAVFLRALCNLDPHTFTGDVVDHFADGNDNNQQTVEEVLEAALCKTPEETRTSFALRLALIGYVTIPLENDPDYLTEAGAAFAPPHPTAKKKPKKASTPIKAGTTKTANKKQVAAETIKYV